MPIRTRPPGPASSWTDPVSIADLAAEVREADPRLTVQQMGVMPPLAQIVWAGSTPSDRDRDLYDIYIGVALSRPQDVRLHTRRVYEHLYASDRWTPLPIGPPTIGLPPLARPDSTAELHIAVINVEDCNYTPA